MQHVNFRTRTFVGGGEITSPVAMMGVQKGNNLHFPEKFNPAPSPPLHHPDPLELELNVSERMHFDGATISKFPAETSWRTSLLDKIS